MPGCAGDHYEISWIDEGRILLLSLSGFWDEATAIGFDRAMRSALAHATGKPFQAVCDASGLAVQRPETLERIQGLLDDMRSAGMEGGAMVLTSALLRMQVGRTVDRTRTSYFDNRAEAPAWVRAKRDPG